jgi:hypothetical protein
MSSSPSGPPLPTLIVTGGASDGVEVPLEGPGAEKTIGSGLSAHLRLTSRNVDATHARVVWEDAAVVLNDEGSAAGTFVNGEKVATGHVLQDGDRISIGPPGSPESVRLLVRVPPDLAAAAAAAPPAGFAPGTVTAPKFTVPAEEEPLTFAEAAAPAAPPVFTPAFAPPSPPAPSSSAPAIIFDEGDGGAVDAAGSAAAAPVAAPSAAAAAAPVPGAPAPAGPVRTPRSPAIKPDYMMDAPSIGDDRVREAPDLPPSEHHPPRHAPAGRARTRAIGMGGIPRAAIVAVAAAALTMGAFYSYSHSRRPPPVLSGVTPPKAEVGTTITITGTGFEASASGNTVRFGDAVAAVTNASHTALAVTVPALSVPATKDVPITVQAGGGRSNALFVKIARLPRIVRVEPDVAVPGTQITIHGQNLDGSPLMVRIGTDRVEVKEARPDALRVTVPEMPWTDGQSVPVTVDVGPDTARAMPLLMGRLPMVVDLTPAYGPVGQRITIKGRGFDPVATANRVTVGGAPALVFAARDSELQAAVPAVSTAGSEGPLPVVVEARGGASSGRVGFALSRPRSGLVRLRFFPAVAPQVGAVAPPDRHAFVSTEIAPVLLLTGKADAGSTAERAGRVASALNTLVEAAATRPVAFEVREGAVPAVAVSGGEVLVTATAEDAQGYAQAWEPGTKPARSTPHQVAAYWAALLQDYVMLFGQGQRPSRTAELSPRGKVLVDLYAEAQRRGATAGVPVATVYELSPAVLKTARDMALLLPTGTRAAGMAVAGRWEGTMADAEAERSIEVHLQVDGGQLAGSLTTKTRGLAVRTPLQQVTYDKGLLKFVSASGGVPRQFRGTLDGSMLSGSIFKDAAAKDAVGRFSLRYVE